ncbi:hypothetical protein E4T44_09389 [Aureobasidium sp. EXF-8845]|nr:hypothetical protein E4T44_09389 [Aureobasidium sp. EXF-8845]KAI4843222.1 hypothetical protein E4T45_08713 [Aureobasidium sp. EXF-8846]
MASIAHRLSPKHLTRDLRELGFKKELVRKFVERPDSVEHATILLKSYSPPSRKPRKGRYNNLCLRKNSRNQLWMVFDPLKHKPLLDKDTLLLTVRFAVFQPGNPRLIEYNTKTTSLRIRSSRIIAGQQINYTANGPVLEPLEMDESDSGSEPAATTTKVQKVTKSSSSKSGSDSSLTDMVSDE